jgi:UDP-N-acetyl-D-glucosamine dehydrogenase
MGLHEKLADRSANVGVVGLGYVGLPLAIEFARVGYRVVGLDADEAKVDALTKGDSHITDVPSRDVREAVRKGRFVATVDSSCIRDMDAIFICVPTPWRAKTADPDLSYILKAVSEVRRYLRRGQLVILESTTFPGTTSEVILPMLEESGLRVGEDFYLVYSPERVDPGNDRFRTRNIPKVVGGITPACTRHAAELYGNALERVVTVSSTEIAEMAKLLENTFRSVNIGFINEFSLLCDELGIDVWEIIDAAAERSTDFMPFYPGPGLGGHCIPVDPLYLSWKAKVNGFHPKLIDVAVRVNQEMPERVVRQIRQRLKPRRLEGSTVLIVGVTYKRDTADLRESPALEIIRLLEEEKARVQFVDPYVQFVQVNGTRLASQPLDPETIRGADCVVIATDHSSFDYSTVAEHATAVVDTRNALRRSASRGSGNPT